MKVKELIEKLQEVDPELDVYVPTGLIDDCNYAYAHSAGIQELEIMNNKEEDRNKIVFLIEEV